ncbi:MAG: ATP-binding cassette domain-containing protein [Cyclobacteriaceae bacterium]|nr:ATP-binding cassette domain-containing protein [Cyclobacteriaceae bacterium]
MNAPTISAEGLSKRYNREWIFRNFTYTFKKGKTYAVTGPNGSGKSTLLQVLWGQMPQSAGLLKYQNDETAVAGDEIYPLVSIATPYMDLIDEFTLLEQINFHFNAKPILPGFTSERVMEAMYLAEAKNKSIAHFSSGMKQRLKLGLAFHTDSPVLFLDEPGTNLDQQAFEWYLTQLETVSKNRLIIVASNQAEEYPSDAELINVMDYKSNALAV